MPVFTAAATALLSSTFLAGSTIATSILASGLAAVAGNVLGVFGDEGSGNVADEGVDVRLAPSTTNRIPVLYGKFQQRGIVNYFEVSEDKQKLYAVIILGEGPVSTIDSIYWEDLLLTLDDDGVVTDATDLDGNSVTRLNGNVTIQTYPAGGRSTFLEGNSDLWTESHTMTNLAYAVVEATYDREDGVTGIPDIRFRGTAMISNPAEAVEDMFTNTTYGLGLDASFIDAASITAATSYFDELIDYVDTDGVDQQQKRAEVNGVLNTGDSVFDRVETILTGCNASLRWSDGKWGIFLNKVDSVEAFTVNEDNIIGSISVTETGLNNLYNAVEVQYGRDVTNNYQPGTVLRQTPAAVRYPSEIDRKLTINLPLVHNSVEAAAAATVILNQGRQQLTVRHRLDATGMPLEAGDVVSYNDVDYGWVDKPFRIISTTEVNDGGILAYDIEAIEYSDDVYDYGVLNETDVAPNVSSNNTNTIEAVDDLAVSGISPAAATSFIGLSWTVPDNSLIESFTVFYNITNTLFSSASTVLGGVERISAGNYTAGATVTHRLIGVPAGDVSIWVVGANDFVSSGSSNRAEVLAWVPVTQPSEATEIINRYNETPSVIAGVDIDVGAPPANATGTGTGRNNDSNDTGWYEFVADEADRPNAPVWTATTQAVRQGVLPRVIEFTQDGVSGDIITEGTDVNQVTDFGFSGTIGNRTTLYEARPSIDTFTLTGAPSDTTQADPGLEPVWRVTSSGTTDATASAANEQFFFYPQGTSGTAIAETFSFTPSGNTAVTGGSFTKTGLTLGGISVSIAFDGIGFTINSAVVPSGLFVVNDVNQLTSNTSLIMVLSDADALTLSTQLGDGSLLFDIANPTGRFTATDGTNTFTVTNPLRVRNSGSFDGGQLIILRVASSSLSRADSFSCSFDNVSDGDTGWQFEYSDDISSSATVTLDGVENTYELTDGLTGAAAVGADLNTMIGTDYDSSWVKTFDATTGVITFTADDFTDRSGSSTSISGSNGSFNLVTSNTQSSGSLTTVQFEIATESIDVTHTVPAGLTGTPLFTNIMSFLSGSTAITDEFTVDSFVTDIPGFTDVTVIRLTANDNTNHTFATTISNGMTGTLSGSLVDGTEAGVATTINITYDSDLMPVEQNITFGANANSVELANAVTAAVNSHAELTAVQGNVVTETMERVSYSTFTSTFSFAVVATVLNEDLTTFFTLIKSDSKEVLAQPIITVTTQGTGDAAFGIETLNEGRAPTPGTPTPMFTTVDYISGGQVLGTVFPFPDGLLTSNALIISNFINLNVDGFSSVLDGTSFTVTSDANTSDRLSIVVNQGVNASDGLSANDLATARTQVNIGSSVEVLGGQATLVALAIGGTTYYSNTYNGGTLEDIIDDLVIGLNTVNTDFNDRFAGVKTDSVTLRATAEFIGETPMITASFTDGSTATADSIGNITTVNSALGISNTEVTPGDELVIVSGELSTFSVTQGSTALITDMEITGASTAAGATAQIRTALSALTDLVYDVTNADAVITATSQSSLSVPTLTLTIDAGLNSDNTTATLSTAKVITQVEEAGSFDLTNAFWEYAITSPTADGDTTMIGTDGTIQVRRGLVLDTTAAEEISGVTETEVLFVDAADTHTTGSRPSTLIIQGSVSMPALTVATAGAALGFIFEQSTDYDPDNPADATWTAIQTSLQVGLTSVSPYLGQIVNVALPIATTFDAAASTTYFFRARRNGVSENTDLAAGIAAGFLIIEELRS